MSQDIKKICPKCGEEKSEDERLCQSCLDSIDFSSGGYKLRKDAVRNVKKEKNIETDEKSVSDEQSIRGYICAFIGIAIFSASFVYFSDSLWVVFNIIFSGITALLFAGAAVFFDFKKRHFEKGQSGTAISALVLSLVCFFTVRGCFYVSPEEIRQKEAKAIAEKQELEKISEMRKKRDEEESKDFASSGQEFKVYGTEGIEHVEYMITSKAKRCIKKFAHDPDSVTDVAAISPFMRIRMKEFPRAKYVINVQFRAKNMLGGLVRQTAFILFDANWEAFMMLEKPLFN